MKAFSVIQPPAQSTGLGTKLVGDGLWESVTVTLSRELGPKGCAEYSEEKTGRVDGLLLVVT